jgi:preprotein translocase subunit SecA
MFRELMNSIWAEFARIIYHVEVDVEPADFEPEPAAGPQQLQYAGGGPEQPSAIQQAARSATGATAAAGVAGVADPAGVGGDGGGDGRLSDENPATVVKSDRDKIGRNDPCWCGSGKKYKKCHGA